MLKHLVPIVAATLLLLIVLASVVPLFDWFEANESTDGLSIARAKWQDQAVESYEIIVTKKCVCGPPGNIPVKIVVRDYLTIAAYDSRTEFDSAIERIDGIPHSIADLFALLAADADDQSTIIAVKFDEQYGFPSYIEKDPDSSNDGDEVAYSVEHFRVTENENL